MAGSSAAAARCAPADRIAAAPASNALKYFERRACENRRDVPIRNDGAGGDGVAEALVVHEGVDAPAIRQSTRVAQLDERIERRAGLIQRIDPIVVPHELGAL